MDKQMSTEKSWDEFRQTGLLWFVNTILHVFGWAITVCLDSDGNIKTVYPARVKFRGFKEEKVYEGYIKIAKYIKENAETLFDEINE